MPKQKTILAACIAVSILLHIGFFLFLQTHSFGFLLAPKVCVTHSLEKVRRDQILKESFASFHLASERYAPSHEAVASPFRPLDVPYEPLVFTPPHSSSFEDLLSSNDFPVRTFPLPALQSVNLFAILPKDLIVLSGPMEHPKDFIPYVEPEAQLPQDVALQPAPTKPPAFSSTQPAFLESSKIVLTMPIPSFPEVPTLAELDTINLSSAFDTELTFSPRKDGPGYLFALTLVPKNRLQIPSLRHTIMFLIDRSNSMQYDRLFATKTAVFQAIEGLEEGTMFNIVAFDHKIDKLSPSPIPMAPHALTKAHEFLSKIQLGSLFTSSDMYKPLFTTIPTCVKDDELYTVILLTDGETLAKKSMQEALVRDWTLYNSGRVSLYAVAMESDTHLATLDVACHFNQGRLVYTNSYRGLKRKLLKLTKGIKYPIVKNITLKAIAKGSQAKIEIHPTPSPSIYLDQPYVLLGSVDTNDDFVLFIQGRLKDQWLNIKKTISFIDAKKGGRFLQSEWALQKAYEQYEKYTFEGDLKYLAEAEALLKPFHLQVAFK